MKNSYGEKEIEKSVKREKNEKIVGKVRKYDLL